MSAPVRLAAQAATVFAGSVVGVLALADSAREHDGVPARLDTQLATDAVNARSGLLTHAARFLTLVGSEVVVSALALLLIIVLLERRGPFLAMCAAVAMAVSASLTVGVKLLVARDRPGAGIRLGPVDSTYSFPSGHALNSAVLIGLVVLLFVPAVAPAAPTHRHQRAASPCWPSESASVVSIWATTGPATWSHRGSLPWPSWPSSRSPARYGDRWPDTRERADGHQAHAPGVTP